MNFENILGNEQNKKILNQIIETSNIAHSYMFTGKEGIGKLLFAKEFAREILNSKNSLENNPDFSIIEPDGNSIKINQIREFTKKVFEKPIVSDKKIFIINNSDLMTEEAQNALLKTLEEPPHYIIIILIAENKNLFLPTIKSRCIEIWFNKLSNSELKQILNKKYNYEANETVLNMADGSASKALKLIENECNYEQMEEIFSNLEKTNLIDTINSKDTIFKSKENIYEILEYINLLILENIRQKKEKYINCIELIEETKRRLKRNNNYDMTIDNLIIRLWEEVNG